MVVDDEMVDGNFVWEKPLPVMSVRPNAKCLLCQKKFSHPNVNTVRYHLENVHGVDIETSQGAERNDSE